jgi:hypothetical protein
MRVTIFPLSVIGFPVSGQGVVCPEEGVAVRVVGFEVSGVDEVVGGVGVAGRERGRGAGFG